MRSLYGLVLGIGLVSLIAWLVASAGTGFDPERRYGARGRSAIGAMTGFGMAGLSAAFAGWSQVAALGAALAGAVAAGWYAGWMGER